jgi:purine-binding chemotaxis protein CheW
LASTPSINDVADPLDGEGSGAGEGDQRLLLFVISGRVYACAIDPVREIVPARRATRLPGAPDFVCGLINLRGAIVTVVDLGRRLGESAGARPDGSIILVEHGGRTMGLAVDEVRDVQPVDARRIEAVSGDRALGGIVCGIGHFDDGVVLLLDVGLVVQHVLISQGGNVEPHRPDL